MAKKTDSSSNKPTVPEKAPAKRKVIAKRAKAPAAKTAKPVARKSKSAIPTFTRDDVALRAYFIAEKRHANGWPGNEHLDWVEAERQLLAESGKRKRTKRA